MNFDLQRVRLNVRNATTEDLISRATVYRNGMEPEALEIIDQELRDRGVSGEELQSYRQEMTKDVIIAPDGLARQCSFCHQPAVDSGWGWHRLWGRWPIFPRFFYYCKKHRIEPETDAATESNDEQSGSVSKSQSVNRPDADASITEL